MPIVSPEQVVNGLVQRGFKPHEAAGIAGNIAQESGFDTGAREITPQTESARRQGGGFGLFQWTSPERKQGLAELAQARGTSPDDLDTQLDYFTKEMNTSHSKAGKALSYTKDPRHAAYIVSKYYEIPSEKYANNGKRMDWAEKIMGMINPISSASASEKVPSFEEWNAANPEQPTEAKKIPSFEEWSAANPEQRPGQQIAQAVTDLGSGVIKGASNIGNSLLSAGDAYNELVGNKNALSSLDTTGEERRAQATEGLKSMGANPDSMAFKTGELGSEIAGTAGVGSALAPVAKAIPYVSKLAPAIESWGMKGGNLAQKAAGGAITGGASNALIDPETAGTGAVVGAALPPAMQLAGKVGQAIGSGIRAMAKPQQEKIAEKIVAATGKPMDEVIDLLTNKARVDELPDLLRTVPQILQDPNISQLARTVKTNSSMALGEAEAAQQNVFKNALEGIAPSGSTVQDAADKSGSAISKSVQGDYKAATKQVSKAFNELRNNPEKNIELPIDKLKATVDQYLGKGTVGKGSGAKSALNEAQNLSKLPKPEKATFSKLMGMTPKAEKETINKVGFKELQNLRSSIGDLAQQAKLSGKNTESTALKQMLTNIDTHLDDLANGGMTSDTLKAYKEARAMHKAKMDRFKTGAQSGLFKPKSNGEMAVEGGEIPGKFYSSRASQSRDVESFKRLVANKSELIGELKQFALTKAGQTATANGNLAQGYVKWAKSHSGANKELFTSAEKSKIDAIAREISNASMAENLGRVTGSDTAQKIKSITDLGLVDNKFINVLANKLPAGNAVLNAIKESSGRERSNMIADLLADPNKLKKALQGMKKTVKPNKFASLAKKSAPKLAPGLVQLQRQQ